MICTLLWLFQVIGQGFSDYKAISYRSWDVPEGFYHTTPGVHYIIKVNCCHNKKVCQHLNISIVAFTYCNMLANNIHLHMIVGSGIQVQVTGKDCMHIRVIKAPNEKDLRIDYMMHGKTLEDPIEIQ